MKASAHAKINLGLHVLRRRSDGYHDIETVFYRIGWADEIEVRSNARIELDCSDPSVPLDDSNLCIKAALLLSTHAGVTSGAHIFLRKNIPLGAGLGGGSSDAAATLRLLDRLWKTGTEERVLNKLAALLGSDVPFFLHDFAAYATGRGEVIEPLDQNGRTFKLPFHLVVAVPRISVSTEEAYAGVVPNDRPSNLRATVLSQDLDRWRTELVNDFEASIFERYPLLSELKREMLRLGAGYASMSGSGSAVFGIFERAEDAERAAGVLQKQRLRVWSDVDEVAV